VGKANGSRERAADGVPTTKRHGGHGAKGAFAHPTNSRIALNVARDARKKKAAIAAASFFLSLIRY
jgi:hypothetical protein